MGIKVALCGKIGAGKSAVAEELIKLGFRRVSFAGIMKEVISNYYKLDVTKFSETKYKEEPRKIEITDELIDIINKRFDISIPKQPTIVKNSLREMLQYLGTDLIRREDDYAHIRQTFKELDKDSNYVFDDARFANECFSCDLSIYLKRDTENNTHSHISEALNPNLCNYVINNNGDIKKTIEEILHIIKEEIL